MAQIELQPLAKDPKALATYIDLNFRRLADAIATLGRVEQFSIQIIGTVVVDTGIPVVKNVVACLESAPVANACLVRAQLDPNSKRNVVITVYKNDFTVAVDAANVNVIVIGDEPPNRPSRSS